MGIITGILLWAWRVSGNFYEEIDLGSIINEKSSDLFRDLGSLRPVYWKDVKNEVTKELAADFPEMKFKQVHAHAHLLVDVKNIEPEVHSAMRSAIQRVPTIPDCQ